jgi:putative ABC transport system permease protein
MNPLGLAWRNVHRNSRRSMLTLTALAVGAMAILLFGGYVNDTIQGLQTSTVRTFGHLQVVQRDYLDFGRGNPARFSIRDYGRLIARIRSDPELAPMLALATPVLDVDGVAGNFAAGTSTNFSGQAVIPSEHARQLGWDGFGKGIGPRTTALAVDAPDAGVIGLGMAQLLSMCEVLQIPNCKRRAPDSPAAGVEPGRDAPQTLSPDIAALASQQARTNAQDRAGKAMIDLLAASPTGMPNVVRLRVAQAEQQAIREVDGMYVAMPLALGQRLVFGQGERGISALVIQLRHTNQMEAAMARLKQLLGARSGLEVLTFRDVSPVYDQIVATYRTIFQFIACLMAAITLFSVANAVNMAISERTGEIGTLRALGFQRGTIRSIFLSEGVLLGMIGAVFGSLLAIALAAAVNASRIMWTPPGRTQAIPVYVDILSTPWLVLLTVVGLTVVASLSALVPAMRASRLEVTEALRYA